MDCKYAFRGIEKLTIVVLDHTEEGRIRTHAKARDYLSTLNFDGLIRQIDRAIASMRENWRNILFLDVDNGKRYFSIDPFEYILIADEVAESFTI